MTFYIGNSEAIAAADAVVDLIDVGATNAQGRIVIYAGSIPADADASIGAATEVATLNMTNPAFGAAADGTPGGVATASAISDDTSATGGTAAFFRIWNRDEATKMQGTVTATGGGGDIELNTVTIGAGSTVSISSLTYTQPES